MPPQIRPEIQAAFERIQREQKAEELIRTRQQGFGRPIVTYTHGDYRFIAVKNRVFWGKGWKFFADFLLHYIKEVLSREWGVKALADGVDHPVFRWFDLFERKAGFEERDPADGVSEFGYVTSLLRLSYALYLLAHHDQIPDSLIKRLQRPQPQLFRPAAYETIVAAAFAVAGFTIQGAELVQTHRKGPEFWATANSDKRYSIEAKCKLAWKARCDTTDAAFREELRAWVRNKLYGASLKQLDNAVYWFELSIPAEFTVDDYGAVQDVISATLREAESMTIHGRPAVPAYVFVTNHSHLVMDMAPSSPFWAMLEGYRIDDLQAGRQVALEEAFDIRDRHREITRVFECLTEVHRVPATFDGNPAELMTPLGEPIATMRLGEHLALEFPDGQTLEGTLSEIATIDDVAWVVIKDAAGIYRMATMPLSEREAAAVRQYGEAIFGKPEGPRRTVNDFVQFYDWLLETFAEFSTEALMRQIPGHPDAATIAALPRPQMLTRVARECAKAFHARQQDQPQQG